MHSLPLLSWTAFWCDSLLLPVGAARPSCAPFLSPIVWCHTSDCFERLAPPTLVPQVFGNEESLRPSLRWFLVSGGLLRHVLSALQSVSVWVSDWNSRPGAPSSDVASYVTVTVSWFADQAESSMLYGRVFIFCTLLCVTVCPWRYIVEHRDLADPPCPIVTTLLFPGGRHPARQPPPRLPRQVPTSHSASAKRKRRRNCFWWLKPYSLGLLTP